MNFATHVSVCGSVYLSQSNRDQPLVALPFFSLVHIVCISEQCCHGSERAQAGVGNPLTVGH